MKKIISLAGPTAAIAALKCPICLLALTGLGAGLGGMTSTVRGAYWLFIFALVASFVAYLLKSWKADRISTWILATGLIGAAGMIYQVVGDLEAPLSWIPGIILSVSSIAALLARPKAAPCACNSSDLFSLLSEESSSKNCLAPSSRGIAYSEDKKEESMANKKRKIEVFTSGCPVCESTVNLVKKLACPSCEVVVYDLNKGCATNECRQKAKDYGISRIPSVVVNGKLLDCCKVGQLTEQALRTSGIGVA